jgi:hypothetical protein
MTGSRTFKFEPTLLLWRQRSKFGGGGAVWVRGEGEDMGREVGGVYRVNVMKDWDRARSGDSGDYLLSLVPPGVPTWCPRLAP